MFAWLASGIAILWWFPSLLLAQSEAQPNVVVFLIDDLGWSNVGCYGSRFHETPHIDALAARGVRFTDAYAACPVCSPSRASVLTGKYPVRSGITTWIGAGQRRAVLVGAPNVDHLASDEETLGEAFQAGGYRTAYFGKWHLGKEDAQQPNRQGFDHCVGVNRAGQPSSYFFPYKRKKAHAADVPDFEAGNPGHYLTDQLAQSAADFIRSTTKQPFLAFISHYSVHTPIQGRPDLVNSYKKKLEASEPLKTSASRAEGAGTTRMHENHPGYASMVASVDASVGKVTATLEELGLTKNTIIVFTSDNGGLSTLPAKRPLGPACVLPLRAGKGWVYEGGIRVPLIIAAPGVPPSVCNVPVTGTDLYPTLLELAHRPAKPEQHVDGRSLVAFLEGHSSPRLEQRALFWHYPHYHGSASVPSAAVRKGPYKLIRWYETGDQELYHLGHDLSETTNLASSQPEIMAELSVTLDKWLKDTNAVLPTKNPDYVPATPN